MGVVEYEFPEDARTAVRELGQRELNGRKVFVKIDETSPNNIYNNS